MSKLSLDPNIITAGLDSGSLTVFSAVVRQFTEPGQYRGTVRRGDSIERVFYLSVDEESPVAAADIDLAILADQRRQQNATTEDDRPDEPETRFDVNPRGYVIFRASSGPGGYSVNVRRADADEKTPVFSSKDLDDGTIFSTQVLQPGEYSVSNAHGEARASLAVCNPPEAFSGYRPPDPIRVNVTENGFDPNRIELMPAQGLIFDCHTNARIVITLERAADDPRARDRAS